MDAKRVGEMTKSKIPERPPRTLSKEGREGIQSKKRIENCRKKMGLISPRKELQKVEKIIRPPNVESRNQALSGRPKKLKKGQSK